MKHLIIVLTALISFSASAQIGSQAIAKQRARDVANQNNNRGTEPPGQTPPAQGRPAAPAISTTPATPGQQAFANFQTQLLGVNTNVTADQKSALARSMGNVAQGVKPSQPTLTKLTDHLTTALAESTKLTPQRKTRLAQDLGMVLNGANFQPAQTEAMIKDIQSILDGGGASAENTSAVTADLTTLSGELKPAAK